MKLKELKNIAEHNTSPQGSAASIKQQLNWLKSAQRLDGITAGTDGYELSIFRYEIDPKNSVIMLTERTNQQIPIGYCLLNKIKFRWFVMDVWLKPELRNRGVITNLYASLSALGYKLQSGDVVSKEAESVWKKLGSAGRAKVLDMETGEEEKFSLKPIGDGDILSGKIPRFCWVTEGKKLNTAWNRGGVECFIEGWRPYLDGVMPGGMTPDCPEFKVIGMGPLVIEADV